MSNLSLVFDVLAKDNASKTFNDVGDAAGRAGKSASGFGTAMSGAMKMAGAALLGAGLVEGFKDLYGAAAESQKIARLTENAIRSTGGAAQVSAKQVGDLAGAIAAKTGIDDEAIQTGQNLLLTFTNVRNEAGKGNDIFNQTTQIMTDMSAVLGTDASGSAIQLGKALNDPIKGVAALTKVGVSFTQQQKDQIRTLVESGDMLGAQKVILAELSKEFGGAAEAAATPLDKLKVQVGNFAEQLGGYLVPAVDNASEFLSEKLLPAFDGVGATITGVGIPAFTAIADLVGGIATAFNALPGPLQAGVIALGAFAALKGPVGGAMETIALKAMYLKDTIAGASFNMAGFQKAGTGVVNMLGGPWGIGLAAGTVLVVGITSSLRKASEQTDTWAQALLEGGAAARMVAIEAQAQRDKQPFEWMANLDEWVGFSSSMEDAQNKARELYDAMTPLQQVNQDVATRTNELSDAIGEFGADSPQARDAATELAKANQDLATQQGQVKSATEQAAIALQGGVDPAEALRTSLEDVATAASDAKSETNLFKTSLDVLNGAHISQIEVEAQFQQALLNAKTALSDTGGAVLDVAGALNLQTENGLKTQSTLIGLHDDANTLIGTMIQQGRTTDEVNAKDAALRDSFYQTALQMTGSKDAAARLTNEIYGIPTERSTTITADTSQATSAVGSLQSQIDGLRGRTVDIVARAIMPDLNGSASGSGRMGTFYNGDYTGDGGKYEPKGVVHGGEFVFTKEETSRAGVPNLRRLAKSLRGYASGGAVPPVSIAAELDASTYDASMNALAGQVIDKYEPVQGFIGALQWAKSQVGKPYIWGSAGPSGYDCSGFMSAITNVIQGRSPYGRLGSTASFPWAGFAPGSGPFTIGSTPNAGGGIGHMAGTLLGVNVESTGGAGVKVGGSARGASNGLFAQRAHLGTFDDGGWLQPGYTMAYNGTGQAERIRTAEQEARLNGGGPIVIQLDGPAVTSLLRGEAVTVLSDASRTMTAQGVR